MSTIYEKSFRQLSYDDLVEHADSLGELADKALDYLEELDNMLITKTEKMKNEERDKLRKRYKKKQIKDKDGNTVKKYGKVVYEKQEERLYTDKEIEDIVNKDEKVPLGLIAIKLRYCKEYWVDKYPVNSETKSKETLSDKVAAARERRKANR